MNSQRWERTKRLFQQALEIAEPANRLAFLHQQCGHDQALRDEVEALLDAHDTSPGFLEQPAIEEAASVASQEHEARMHGRRIGPWRIQRLLDHGGMGSVYLAERAAGGFEQTAALKLLRPGLVSAEVVQRFEQERQILASLDHPDIAGLLDGGNTEEGQPWLAMEYIQGEPIDQWCNRHRLDVGARVDLLRRVAEAVQYAHQKLVVHRDLKPSNILVTANGEPRLLDFGIAKLLRVDDDAHLTSATASPMLTPDYASPEQVRGDPVTTATDVYALGILLYRLLAGSPPYHVTATSPRDLLTKVCDEVPLRPSATLRKLLHEDPAKAATIASERGSRPKRLLRALSGDLDTLVMTALRKEAVRRYATPGLLATDLSRWQRALPINARPDSVKYRSGKFIRRHKAGLTATVLVILALVGGLGAAVWQADRATRAQQLAEARFNDVRQLANTLVFDLHDAIADLPGSTHARQLLVKSALEYLKKLRHHAAGEPDLLRDLAAAWVKIGDVQGHPEKPSLGNLEGALQSYRQALALRRELVAKQPSSPQARYQLANALDRVAMALWWQDHTDAALKHYHLALDARRKATDLGGNGPKYQRGLAATHEGLARVLAWNQQLDKAMAGYQVAVPIREAQLRADPDNPQRARELAKALNLRGHAQSLLDSTQAIKDHQRAIAVTEKALERSANDPRLVLALVRSRTRLGQTLKHFKRHDEAIAEHRKALAAARKLVASDPNDTNARMMLAWSEQAFAESCYFAERLKCAAAHAQPALALHQQLAAENPANKSLKEDIAVGYLTVAKVRSLQGHHDLAEAAYREALKVEQQRLDANPDAASLHSAIAGIHLNLGENEYARAMESKLSPKAHRAALTEALEQYRAYFAHEEFIETHGNISPSERRVMGLVRDRVTEVQSLLKKGTEGITSD